MHKLLTLVKKLINRKVIIAVAIVIVILVIGNRNAQNTSQIQTQKVEPKDINATVTASGTVQADQSTDLHFQAGGQLAWVGVKEGDQVKKGQALASLNTQVLQKQLKEDLNTYLKTRLNFEDTKDSQEGKVITDELKRIAQRSQADLENSVTDVEIQNLAIQFSTITSPIDGYVISKPKFYPGENVALTDTIVTVANTKDMQFLAQVDESDIGNVRLGQTASISLDAYPNNAFTSTVSFISQQAVTTSTGSTAFNVTFDMGQTQEPLYIGMNGSADITTATKENVLTVPIEAILNDNYVWVKNGSSYRQVKVEQGISSDTDVEITSGLKQGDVVATAGFDQIGKSSLFQKLTRLVSK